MKYDERDLMAKVDRQRITEMKVLECLSLVVVYLHSIMTVLRQSGDCQRWEHVFLDA